LRDFEAQPHREISRGR